MLRVPELYRREFFRGIAARVPRAHGDYRIAIEDLRDDGMAPRLRAGARCGALGDAEVAEPVDFQSDFDRAEGRGACLERPAALRGGNAVGIHQAPRSRC